MQRKRKKAAAPEASYKRADSLEQKRERRQAILDGAAAELDRLRSVDEFTMDALARRLGLSRGTIYLYFPDKYAIFQVLCVELINRFLEEMASVCATLPPPATARQLAHTFCGVLKGNGLLGRLPQLLRNRPAEGDRTLEKEIEAMRARADAAIVAHLPGLRPGDGRQLLHYGFALLQGFSEVYLPTTKSPVSDRALQAAEDGLVLVLEGLLASARRGEV